MPRKDTIRLKMHQNKFMKYFLEGNILIVSIIIIVSSLMIFGGLLNLGGKIFHGKIPEYYFGFSGIIFLLIAGCCGLLQVVRGEAPGPLGNPTYGLWAKISGWVILVISWGGAAYLLIYTLIIWLH